MDSIWIGFDPRPAEVMAFAVTRESVKRHLSRQIPVFGLVLDELRAAGLYTRPTEVRASAADRPVLWDVISDAPMATEFAISRFLVPHLARQKQVQTFRPLSGGSRSVQLPPGWALFMDGDMLARVNLARLTETIDRSKAVYCVKHNHVPAEGVKMDGQVQTAYSRKNWSSFMLFNCGHEANRELTVDMVNRLPGRDLHRFCWLDDSEIGELDPSWNWLVGHSDPFIEPKVVHFTDGCPNMAGYENVRFADEWRCMLGRWAA